MSDRVEHELRSMVFELIESSPPPHPAHEALGSIKRPELVLTLRSGLRRMVMAAVVVLLVGFAGAWVGQHVLPAIEVSIVSGTPAPEPLFDPSKYGREIRLLPFTDDVQPDVLPATLDGEVTAAGRIEGTDLVVFTWRTTEPIEGSCLQVIGPGSTQSTCSGSAPGESPALIGPRLFPRVDQAGDLIDVAVAWQVAQGSVIVVAEAGDSRIWQRPRGGVVAFIFDRDIETVILHALDARGEIVSSQGVSPKYGLGPPQD